MKRLQLNSEIITERCIIKMPELWNAQEIYDLIDDDITKYMAWSRTTPEETKSNMIKCREEVEAWISWEWAIFLNSGECIWRFWIHDLKDKNASVSLWYFIGKDYWWKWYIPECIDAFKKIAFHELWVNKIIIRYREWNVNSYKVAEKCWFQHEGILRADAYEKGEFVDKVYYSFLKSDYEIRISK